MTIFINYFSYVNTNKKHVLSARDKGRLSGETRSICEGKNIGTLEEFVVVEVVVFQRKCVLHLHTSYNSHAPILEHDC